MIFRFSEEQKTQLQKLELQINAENTRYMPLWTPFIIDENGKEDGGGTLFTLDENGKTVPFNHEILGKDGKIDPKKRDALKRKLDKEVPQAINKLTGKFESLINQFETDHFKTLKDAADIQADALQTAKDGIYGAFLFFEQDYAINNPDGIGGDGVGPKNEIPTAPLPETEPQSVNHEEDKAVLYGEIQFRPRPFSWDYQDEIDKLEKTEKSQTKAEILFQAPPFYIDQESLYRWITGKVINKHLARLDGQPQHDELLTAVNTLIKSSPLTAVWPNSAEYWQEKDKETEEQKKAGLIPQCIETVTVKKAANVSIPVDKVNSLIWNNREIPAGVVNRFDVSKKGSNEHVDVMVSINFDELEKGELQRIIKQLNAFDKRVYEAISSLYYAGNNIVSFTQIYKQIGNKNRPAPNQLQKIQESIQKMQFTRVFIDNTAESEAYKGRVNIRYSGYLLPIETAAVNINGQTVETAVKIFREPPLMTLSRSSRQLTTVPAELLQSPISKTEENVAIDNYLIERISREKKTGSTSCTILLETLYARTNITTSKQKQRAPEKIAKLLDHYKAEKWITEYTHKKKEKKFIIKFEKRGK